MTEQNAIRIGLIITLPILIPVGIGEAIYHCLKYRDIKWFNYRMGGALAFYQLLWDLDKFNNHKISEYVKSLEDGKNIEDG